MESEQQKWTGFLSRLKFWMRPNRKTLPLKLVIFFFACSSFSFIPYLTVHMKDIGITIEDIALIYLILPFANLVSNPLTGFMADKLGSFTRVIIMALVGDAVFFSLLLAVPPLNWVSESTLSNATVHFSQTDEGHLRFEAHEPAALGQELPEYTTQMESVDLRIEFMECGPTAGCPNTQYFAGFCDAMARDPSRGFCGNGTMRFETVQVSDFLHTCESISGVLDVKGFGSDCEFECKLVEDSIMANIGKCLRMEGNRRLTLVLYFIFRCLGQVCLACGFIIVEALTIQMCKLQDGNDEGDHEIKSRDGSADTTKKQSGHGSIGRQVVFTLIAQATISPFIGKLMDLVAEMSPSGEPNYLVPFASNLLFLAFTITALCFIPMDLQLPKGSTKVRDIVDLFKSVDILVFLLLMLVFGTFYGFMENFLFIYLKDDLGAPMSLLGFTITVGALFSIPFIFFADPIVDYMGRENTFLLALAMYCIRYVGYSFITSPYLAFPFEALELFTNNLMRIASIQWVGSHAPPGLLATLNGVVGGIHFGFGKGFGSLIGGNIISISGSTAKAYRAFGFFAGVSTVVYFVYIKSLRKLCTGRRRQREQEDRDEQEMKSFIDNEETKASNNGV